MSGGGTSKSTNVTKTEPWKKIQPNMIAGLERLGEIRDAGGYKPYEGQTLAGVNPMTNLGYQMSTQRALQGNPMLNQAKQTSMDMLNNKGMNPMANSFLNRTLGMANLPGQNSMMNQEAMNTMQGNMYPQDMANRYNIMSLMPQFSGADERDINLLDAVGQSRQQDAQAQLTDQANRWNEAQGLQKQFLSDYLSQAYGYGNTARTSVGTTTTQTPGSLATPLGIAGMIGAGLLAIPSGGMSLAAMPGIMGAAGMGGMLGNTIGGQVRV